MKAFDIGPLEFEKVAGLVSAHAVCAEAKQRLLELAPAAIIRMPPVCLPTRTRR